MKDDRVYLRHILECVEAIGGYITQGRPQFFADRKTQKAALRELQELSESVQRLSPELRARHPEVPWAAIAGFRNVLVHDSPRSLLPRLWRGAPLRLFAPAPLLLFPSASFSHPLPLRSSRRCAFSPLPPLRLFTSS